MKIIDASYEILDRLDGQKILEKIERIGRICYDSSDKVGTWTAEPFVANLVKRKHYSVLEHFSFSVLFVINRRVSHEVVRHRHFSFSQASQRYIDMQNGVTFINLAPTFPDDMLVDLWLSKCRSTEKYYQNMRDNGLPPQIAGGALDNDVATKIVLSGNLRCWLEMLEKRTQADCHPQMYGIMRPLCLELKSRIPVVFDSITWQ